MTQAQDRSLTGAVVLSAVGSTPLQLVPVVVASTVGNGTLLLAQAGWTATALLAGQLVASTALPATGLKITTRTGAVAASALALASLSASTGPPTAYFASWFGLGLCCGSLQYLGITTAAAGRRPGASLAARLGLILTLTGVTVALLGGAASYPRLVATLCWVLAAPLLVGCFLFARAGACKPPGQPDRASAAGIGSLTVLLVMLAGQTGFIAYAIRGVVAHGVEPGHALVAFAAIKVGAGVVLLAAARWLRDDRPRFLAVGTLLVMAVAATHLSRDAWTFAAGFLLLEVALNRLSANLQAQVARTDPRAVRWLTATILVGAGLGPPLYGSFLAHGLGDGYLAVAITVSALLPACAYRR